MTKALTFAKALLPLALAAAYASPSTAQPQVTENEEATAWYQRITGKTPDPTATKLELDIGVLPEATRCFPEDELRHLCSLPFGAVRFLSVYRDSCPAEQKISSVGISHAGRCLPALEAIDLDANDLASLAGIEALPKSMKEIKLIFNNRLASSDLTIISEFPTLTSLNMQSVPLTDAALSSLHSQTLQFLDIKAKALTTTQGIGERLPSLKGLVLRDAGTVDRSVLEPVLRMPELLTIQIAACPFCTGMQVTDAAKAWLIHEAPSLIVGDYLQGDDLKAALSPTQPRQSVFVNRRLSAEEYALLFKISAQRINFSALNAPAFISAAKAHEGTMTIGRMAFQRDALGDFNDDDDVVKYEGAVLESLAGSNVEAFKYRNVAEFNWNTTRFEVLPLAPQ